MLGGRICILVKRVCVCVCLSSCFNFPARLIILYLMNSHVLVFSLLLYRCSNCSYPIFHIYQWCRRFHRGRCPLFDQEKSSSLDGRYWTDTAISIFTRGAFLKHRHREDFLIQNYPAVSTHVNSPDPWVSLASKRGFPSAHCCQRWKNIRIIRINKR